MAIFLAGLAYFLARSQVPKGIPQKADPTYVLPQHCQAGKSAEQPDLN